MLDASLACKSCWTILIASNATFKSISLLSAHRSKVDSEFNFFWALSSGDDALSVSFRLGSLS